MTSLRRIMSYVLLGVSGCLLHPSSALAQIAPAPAVQHDRQHDFDFEDGTWKIHLKRLQHPLTGSHTWVEFDGTSTTRQLWNGNAHIEQFETDGAAGHIEGLTLRIYRPQSHQWSIHWANSDDGTDRKSVV